MLPSGANSVNAHRFDKQHQARRAVTGIALQDFRLAPRSASGSRGGRHVDQQWQRDLVIARISRRRLHDQRQALRISQHLAFAARFRAVRRVGPGVRPPKNGPDTGAVDHRPFEMDGNGSA